MWLDKVKSATFMFFKVFKVLNFLNLNILFVIVEDPPLQRIVRSRPPVTRNINDDMDMPLQQYREGQKKKEKEEEMIHVTYLCNLFDND